MIALLLPVVLMSCKTVYRDADGESGDGGQKANRKVSYFVDFGVEDKLAESFSTLLVLEGKKVLCEQDSTMMEFGNPIFRLKEGKHILTFVATRGTNVIYDESNGIISALNSPYSLVVHDTIVVAKEDVERDVVLQSKTAEVDVHFADFAGNKIFITMDIYRALNVQTMRADSIYEQRTLWYNAPSDAQGDYTFSAYVLATGEYSTDVTIYTNYKNGTNALPEKTIRNVRLKEGTVTKLDY